jgi:hypothetical protein
MTACECLISTILIAQLRRVFTLRRKFDGDLLLVEQIGALEDDAKGPLPDFVTNAVVGPDDVQITCIALHDNSNDRAPG